MAELEVSTMVKPEIQVQKFQFDSNVNRFIQPFRMMIAGRLNVINSLIPNKKFTTFLQLSYIIGVKVYCIIKYLVVAHC